MTVSAKSSPGWTGSKHLEDREYVTKIGQPLEGQVAVPSEFAIATTPTDPGDDVGCLSLSLKQRNRRSRFLGTVPEALGWMDQRHRSDDTHLARRPLWMRLYQLE